MEAERIKIKSDVYINDIYTNEEKGYYIIGCYSNDSFFLVKEEKIKYYMNLFSFLNGEYTIEELEQLGLGSKINLEKLVSKLKYYGLIEGYDKKEIFSEVNIMTLNIYEKKVSFKNDKIKKYSDILVNNYGKCICTLLIILSVMIFLLSYKNRLFKLWDMTRYINISEQYNGVVCYLIILLFTPLALIIHEVGHRIVGIKNDLYEGKIAIVMFMYIIPLMYVKQKNIYSLKRKRIIQVIISGVASNLLIGILSLVVALITNNIFVFYFAMANLKLIFINLLPFSLSDGYFLLSVILRIPNIRMYMYQIINKPKTIIKRPMRERFLIIVSVLLMIGNIFLEINWLCSFISIKYRLIIVIIVNIGYLLILRNKAKKYIN